MTLIGIVISTRLMNPQLAHQCFNDPLMEFKSSATGLNESINPAPDKCAPFISVIDRTTNKCNIVGY